MYKFFLCLTLFCGICISEKYKIDMYSTVSQLIGSSGYPMEKHLAHTTDGYVLQVYRIPGGRLGKSPPARGKRAVLLVHGLTGSCDNYLIMGYNRSLAYMLADAGYDVWLGNLRGNYFTSHQTLTRKDPAFWEYSFHEHGKFDAPAIIDKMLNVTGLSKIIYVGHSMGCTTFLTMMAQRPEYNDKIVAFVALAPAAYEDNITSIGKYILEFIKTLKHRGMLYVAIPKRVLQLMTDRYCTARKQELDVCMALLYNIVGEDYEQHDWDMTQTIIGRVNPVSYRQLLHYMKIAYTGVFTSWEDGLNGAVKPYNLRNVRCPVCIWYGEKDILTEKTQVLRLAKELNETGVLYALRSPAWPKFNHLDFVVAKDVRQLLNLPLLDQINELFDKFDNK